MDGRRWATDHETIRCSRDLSLPPLGDEHQTGISVLVTKTLLFVSARPAGSKWGDEDAGAEAALRLRQAVGRAPAHAIELDGLAAAAPMTYLHRGKQYIVTAVGIGPASELVALSLP